MNTKLLLKVRGVILIVVIILIIFVGFLIFRSGDSGNDNLSLENSDDGLDNSDQNKNFDKAPNFSLQDVEGNAVELNNFEDKVLVINSWATWCPFCVDELPDFGKLQKEFPDEMVMIAINRRESLEKSKAFTDNLEITEDMLYLLDPSDSFYRSIGGFSMPETIFVDKDKNIRIHKRGPIELDEMITKVNSILNQ